MIIYGYGKRIDIKTIIDAYTHSRPCKLTASRSENGVLSL